MSASTGPYKRVLQLTCTCGHKSLDHSPWPVCDKCKCVEYRGEVLDVK